MEGERVAVSEMAGNLLAELYSAKDLHKQGLLNDEQVLAKIRLLRRRARSGSHGLRYDRAPTGGDGAILHS